MSEFSRKVAALSCNGSRIILLANNPKLTKRDIHTLGIGKEDIIIQFNKCIHSNIASKLDAQKVFIFSHNHLNSAFGFLPNGEPEQAIKSILENRNDIAQIVFTYWYPDKIKSGLTPYGLSDGPIVLRNSDIDEFKYPSAKIPSVGFLTFLALTGPATKICSLGGKDIYIYCVGFNGRIYEEHEDVFHDFTYERHIILSSQAIRHRCYEK